VRRRALGCVVLAAGAVAAVLVLSPLTFARPVAESAARPDLYTVSTPLPVQRNVLQPHNVEPGAPDKQFSGAWATFTSPATPWTPLPGESWYEPQRFLRFNHEYWVLWSFRLDPDWRFGFFTRILNFHQVAVDGGEIYSPLAIDLSGQGHVQLNAAGCGTFDPSLGTWREVASKALDAGPARLGVWYDSVLRVRFDAGAGHAEWWLNGKRIGQLLGCIGYTGATTQQLWEGTYAIGNDVGGTLYHEAARVGATLPAALNDVPVGPVHEWSTLPSPAFPGSKASSTESIAPQRPRSAFVVPAGLAARVEAGRPVPAVDPAADDRSVAGPQSLQLHTDADCPACRVAVRGGTITAAIEGGPENLDTAYAARDFGGPAGWSGRVFVRDRIELRRGRLSANLAVTQVRDVHGGLVYELYVGGDGILRLWSPPGGLQARSINDSTGVALTQARPAVTAEVAAKANASVVVRVDGVTRLSLTGLSGATTGNQRYLRAGIDHYDASDIQSVVVAHSQLAVQRDGWPRASGNG
jgi:hypothetical protein